MQRLRDGSLAVPRQVAPASDNLLEHVLFALKHEGINLQVLAGALPRIGAEDMLKALQATPNGVYVRKAAVLWEHFSARMLPATDKPGGAPYVLLFDPKEYITGTAVRHPRWRIVFNGLGNLHSCATVRTTRAIEALLATDILGEASRFALELGKRHAGPGAVLGVPQRGGRLVRH